MSRISVIGRVTRLGEYEPRQRLKADSHIACRAHAIPLPCRAAKGLEFVFTI